VLGFHFRFQMRVNWPGLVPVFNERASLLGCAPPGPALQPRATRVIVSGAIDKRLREGGLRYEYVLYGAEGQVVDVQLGRTGEPLGIHFGVDPRTAGAWCSDDTLGFSSAGLFVPEQRTADGERLLPASFVAHLDLWTTLSSLAEIAFGGPTPERNDLPSAPGWRLTAAPQEREPELVHALAGLSFTLAPMVA
jgi:hypothetical protein